MIPHQRRERILELLKEDGSAKVADLARIFKVTEVTIRQDLDITLPTKKRSTGFLTDPAAAEDDEDQP